MTAIHKDRLIRASNTQWPEIQPHVSRGQIISVDLPLLTDGRTENYNFSTMILYVLSLHLLWRVQHSNNKLIKYPMGF